MGRRRGGGGGRGGEEERAVIDKRNDTDTNDNKNKCKAAKRKKVPIRQLLCVLLVLVGPDGILARFVPEDGAMYSRPKGDHVRQNSGPANSPLIEENLLSDPFRLKDPFGRVSLTRLGVHSKGLRDTEGVNKKLRGDPLGFSSQSGKPVSLSQFSQSSTMSTRQGYPLRHHFHTPTEISEEEAQWLYLQLTDSTVYDRQVGPPRLPPVGPGDQSPSPLEVISAVYVYYIGDINSQDAKYNTIVHITHAWKDPRLEFVNLTRDVVGNETHHPEDNPGTKRDSRSTENYHLDIDQEYLSLRGDLKDHLYPDGDKESAAIVSGGFKRHNDKEEERDACIIGGEAEADLVWLPPVYVVNEAAAQITGIRQRDEYITVCSRGHVFYEYRLQATLYCPMELSKFPFDKQTCDISIESWKYSTDEMILQWCKEEEEDGEVRNSEKERRCKKALVVVHGPTSEFDLTSYTGTVKQVFHPPRNLYSEHGRHLYSRLGIQFSLQRAGGHYVLDYYLPGLLLVTVSWVSFWLDPTAAPARITLGTSTLLTFVTMTSNAKGALPKVPYVKVLDWWFFAGILFIFCSLIEYAFVNTIHRRKDLYELKKVDTRNILKSTMSTSASSSITSRPSTVCTRYPSTFSSLPNLKYTSGRLPKDFTEMNELTVASISQLTVGSLDSMLRQSTRHSSSSDKGASEELESSGSLEELRLQVPHVALRHRQPHLMTPQETAAWIDRRARVAFPVAFAIFNVVYWALIWW